jgi:signal peptidase I
MADLDFRKKHRRQAKRKQNKKKNLSLKFDSGKAKSRVRKVKVKADRKKNREIMNWCLQIGLTCAVAFMLVWFWGQRVSNAGDSMKPVLHNGDVVMVNRLVYNASKPRRGDIITFKPNGNENTHYSIKRIVGLPGETLQIKDGSIYINGEKITKHIYVQNIDDAGIADEAVKLGGDEYFVIGDNHAGSDDSRMADIGNVKRNEIYGKVWFVASFGSDFGFVKR